MTTKILATGSGVVVIGGTVLTSTYVATKTTILEGENKKFLLLSGSDYDRAWSKKVAKLNADSGLNNKELEAIKNLEEKDEKTKANELQKWCEKQYSKTISSAFQSEDKELIDLVEKWCIYTIGEATEEDVLPQVDDKFNEQWKEKVKEAEKDNDLKEYVKGSSEDEKVKELKKWCSDQYSEKYEFKNKSEKSKNLESQVNKWCVYTIAEKLKKNNKDITKVDEVKWKSLFKDSLKTFNNTTEITLTIELKKIKEDYEKDTDGTKGGWKALKAECGKIYKKGYQGEETNLWKLADKLCYKA